MDLRKSKLSVVDDKYIAIEPTVSGAAEKITKEQENTNKSDKIISDLINECNKRFHDGLLTLDHCVETIDQSIDRIEKSTHSFTYENSLIALISYAISHDELDERHRERYCDIWINGMYRIMNMGSFLADYQFSIIFFVQIEKSISQGTKNRIKKLMLDCILYCGPNGTINNTSRLIHNYLLQKPSLSKIFFNTIVKLSEDEMNHQKYNANYAISHQTDGASISFIPNMQPKLIGVDYYIKEKGTQPYSEKKNEIIEDYLYNEKQLDLSSFKISDYDISVMMRLIVSLLLKTLRSNSS